MQIRGKKAKKRITALTAFLTSFNILLIMPFLLPTIFGTNFDMKFFVLSALLADPFSLFKRLPTGPFPLLPNGVLEPLFPFEPFLLFEFLFR